jgi:predicted HicB family RNase H-like nuclease
MTPNNETLTHSARRQEAVRVATQMFGQNPDWVTFFREILGVEGVARRLFTTQEQYVDFEKSEEFIQIQNMVATLRQRSGGSQESLEPTRVITVRLPKSLHEALRAEAHDHKTSMNKLCISKLLQVLADAEEEAAANAALQANLQRNATPTPSPAAASTSQTRPTTSFSPISGSTSSYGSTPSGYNSNY